MSKASSDTGIGGVQSVDRALQMLELLAREGEAGVTELAAAIGVHKSTASRLLGSLEERGLVEQFHGRGKYHLGLGILRLAHAVPGRLDLTEQARDVCERLAAQVGETVNLAVLRSHFAVNVEQARGPSAIGTHNWVGELTPLHATSSGKVLLASMSADKRKRLLGEAGMSRFTDRTITSMEELDRQLAVAERDGYATTCEELEIGLNAVAAPVRDHAGVVIAALSVSGPAFRVTAERKREIMSPVIAAAIEIGHRLGFHG
ncbi:IclR family transcriptional regulator [Mycobacterium stomatepiae]|uniref:Glycerol operon regulatory protein n=1 Tax=Mycobacterium stomatepiae TaxID=470076 RepID=A0A7I7Q7Y4_9MYCO|nr:IclR family transcriptional regulator [Mycobacterium stomatepiae]MCV7163048.1 IclR family transcriptional regulator [Mycobacterium stomatepiae]BBY22202.1 IclR family transcriptional regulator [Mycobacterium stomatepiae]